ncbi:neutral zinc metallopeptidase [Planobispora longispora]|uniref:Metalloprotease n=1 Tax=Planobispora longispora TaxID=28887 RepID=A0A8J3RHC8_9ACTN|nr:neutral zinc metallopeptidase [Planobispora longispora]GIH74740.1 hypothetical protein Plo01_11690 [Planobispora longispora]
MSGPRDWSPGGGRRRGAVRRILPVMLVFAVVVGGTVYLRGDLQNLLGTAPGSARSAVATHSFHSESGPVGGRCEGLPEELDADADATLTALARCLDRMWEAVLEPAGVDYEEPAEVRLVGSPEEAACGTEDFDWAGIYCGGEAVVNVLVEGGPDDGSGDGSDDGSDDGSGDGEVFPVMFTLAHEYAHHVQAIVGISAQDGSEVFDEAWSRRLELQADCLAAAALRDVQPYLLNDLRRSLAHGTETDATEEDAAEQRASHGSSRSGALWMLRGQREGTVGACNTWKAPEGEVS